MISNDYKIIGLDYTPIMFNLYVHYIIILQKWLFLNHFQFIIWYVQEYDEAHQSFFWVENNHVKI